MMRVLANVFASYIFQDKHGKWLMYGDASVENEQVKYRSDKESLQLESDYIRYTERNGPADVPFETNGHKYTIFFERNGQPVCVQKNNHVSSWPYDQFKKENIDSMKPIK
jgi:hypothetical protein